MKTKISSKIITAFLAIALSALSAFCFVIPAKTVKAETDNTPENVKTADVFMIAGQSNAAGSTRADSTKYGYEVTYRPRENVLYYGGTHKTVKGGAGRYLRDFRPVQHGCGFTDNHVGFELGMANRLNEREEYKGENKKAIIFKSASGGTSVMPEGNYGDFGNWYPESLWTEDYWQKDKYYDIKGFQYRVFIDELKRFLFDAKAEGFEKINLKGLFWMQGETDRGRADDYVTVCSALFSDFRKKISEITGEDYSALPIFVGEISETFSSALPASVELNRQLIAAQHKIANIMPAVYVADIHGYEINKIEFGNNVVVGSDQSHWNYEDIVSIGEDFMTLYDEVSGNIVGSVLVDVEGSSSAVERTTVTFNGEYGANFAKDTESMYFTVKTNKRYKVKEVTTSHGTVAFEKSTFVDGDVEPTLKYKLTGMQNGEKITVKLESNTKISVSVTGDDETYGSIPSNKMVEDAYLGCKYTLETYPFSDGALYKFEINGKTVYGEKNVNKYVFDNWEQYVGENGKLEIKVFYGEKNDVNNKLDGIASGTTAGGCSCSAPAESLLPLMTLLTAALLLLFKRRSAV